MAEDKLRLLLHICCGGCGAYVGRLLSQDYSVSLYFYNPNIDTAEEYFQRESEVKKVAANLGVELILEEYKHEDWLKKAKGLEDQPERGLRCEACFHDRLEKTAAKAKESAFSYFATTLTVSPHKDAARIISIGERLGQEFSLEFLAVDFKKKNGFLASLEMSKALSLKRQNYCGCEFSKR